MSVKFSSLIDGGSEREISSVFSDSRKACAGSLFVCVVGANSDGHDYAKAAYYSGCRAFISERGLDLPSDADIVKVDDSRAALAHAAAKFYSEPSKKLRVIGVTGTKGKSTVAYMVYHIFNTLGIRCAYIGTLGVYYDGTHERTDNSTPESLVLQEYFARFFELGITDVVMEVSSQSVKQNRICGIDFTVGAFLNLYEGDHIGPTEHADFDEYRGCKAKFCREFVRGAFVYNASSPFSQGMIPHGVRTLTFNAEGCDGGCLCADNIRPYTSDTAFGYDFDAVFGAESYPVRLNMCGEFNVSNALAAMQISRACDISYTDSAAALGSVAVPGRCEITGSYPSRVFVLDYAHNEVSLRSILSALRCYSPKRLVCVIGSVGDRTESRRRGLGAAASEGADFVIVTSDNPGHEEPRGIIDDIVSGFTRDVPYAAITDREQAVRYAVRNSQAGDIVVFAGKGHEDYQLVGDVKVPFSEKTIIADEISHAVVAV